MNVKDPSGGVNTARVGKISDTDYSVSCDIYCNFRPALSADGYERVGIFVRDDGNGIFEGTNGAGTIRGNNYSLTWDSNNGRVQCLKTVNGVPSDLLGSPMFVASSGWRTFGIEVVGSSLTFKIDGLQILNAVDSFRAAGQFGIGFHEYFITNANLLGTYADNFSATTLASSKVPDWVLYQ